MCADKQGEKFIGYECSKCGQHWPTKRSLGNHFSSCKLTEETSTICNHCGKDKYFLAELKRHLDNVSGKAKVNCKICNTTISNKNNLKIHMKRVHPNNEPNPRSNPDGLPCETCGKRFKTPATLRIHIRFTHLAQKVKCNYCLKDYRPRALYSHIQTQHPVEHLKNREEKILTKEKVKSDQVAKLQCIMCGQQFKRQFYLFSHLKAHIGERGFICRVCGEEFLLKRSLADHLWRKHGSEGNKLFEKMNLKVRVRHLKFSCGACWTEMYNADNLLSHVIRVHGANESARRKWMEIQEERRLAASINLEKNAVPLMKRRKGKKLPPLPRACHGCYVCGEKFICETFARDHVSMCEKDNGILLNANPR